MVQEANIKRAQAEKALAESEMKVENKTKIISSLICRTNKTDVLLHINIVLQNCWQLQQIFTRYQKWKQ